MCELFGVTSKDTLTCNELLKEFYSHSTRHPHGWGLAVLDGIEAQILKEPMQASRSFYLHERLTAPVSGKTLLAHIRYATIGNIDYKNCHPYTGKDESGRRWTLIHNGTIFDYPPLARYLSRQLGDTDSERIFLHLLHLMNQKIREGHDMTAEERFRILDQMVCEMSVGNKLNLLIYDGEYLYVHTNNPNSLYVSQKKDLAKFATTPLDQDDWNNVPMTTLLAYQDGNLAFTGTNHGNEYEYSQEDLNHLYQIFADL